VEGQILWIAYESHRGHELARDSFHGLPACTLLLLGLPKRGLKV
jgi:hypothetical protein